MLKLSPQQYAGVLTSLQSSAASSGSEKRQFTRMEVQAPVRLAAITDKKISRTYIALTRDISLNGIGLCQAAKFEKNEEFLISLTCGKQHIVLDCHSVFCRALADGIFCIGAIFDAISEPARVEEFRTVAEASIKNAAA
jgi:hypothetical protein